MATLAVALLVTLFTLAVGCAGVGGRVEDRWAPAGLTRSAVKQRVWVYFSDKDNRSTPRALHVRAVSRRTRRGWLDVDSQRHLDRPVSPAYVEAVAEASRGVFRPTGSVSRWLNAASFEIPFLGHASRAAVLGLPFVDRIETVRSGGSLVASYDYGVATAQMADLGVAAIHGRNLSGHGVRILLLDSTKRGGC